MRCGGCSGAAASRAPQRRGAMGRASHAISGRRGGPAAPWEKMGRGMVMRRPWPAPSPPSPSGRAGANEMAHGRNGTTGRSSTGHGPLFHPGRSASAGRSAAPPPCHAAPLIRRAGVPGCGCPAGGSSLPGRAGESSTGGGWRAGRPRSAAGAAVGQTSVVMALPLPRGVGRVGGMGGMGRGGVVRMPGRWAVASPMPRTAYGRGGASQGVARGRIRAVGPPHRHWCPAAAGRGGRRVTGGGPGSVPRPCRCGRRPRDGAGPGRCPPHRRDRRAAWASRGSSRWEGPWCPRGVRR